MIATLAQLNGLTKRFQAMSESENANRHAPPMANGSLDPTAPTNMDAITTIYTATGATNFAS